MERMKTIDFDHYYTSVWCAVNKAHSKLSQPGQFEQASYVINALCLLSNSSVTQAGTRQASFVTRSSGIQTLRKIGKTLCMSNDIIGREVRKHFQREAVLEYAMGKIVAVLSTDERRRICSDNNGRSTFSEKMYELRSLAKVYCLFGLLAYVISDLHSDAVEVESREVHTDDADDVNESGSDGEDDEEDEDEEDEEDEIEDGEYDDDEEDEEDGDGLEEDRGGI